MIVRLLDRLHLVRGVWLVDFQGDIYASWAKEDEEGRLAAHVYPLTRVGSIVLLPSGKVMSPSGSDHYIQSWSWMRDPRSLKAQMRGKRVELPIMGARRWIWEGKPSISGSVRDFSVLHPLLSTHRDRVKP